MLSLSLRHQTTLAHASPYSSASVAAKLTIDELSKRKWLRHVDFISVASKLEPCANTTHLRRLLYHSLMWKLAAFFLADWLDTMQSLAAIQTSGVGNAEDEEIRQRLRVRLSCLGLWRLFRRLTHVSLLLGCTAVE